MSNAETGFANGRTVVLADLIEVQTEAVVSRTLIKQDGGTLTLFAFDQGQELSEHTAPFDALVQVLAGESEVSVEGVGRTVSAGEAILMPAHRPHALRALQPFKMLLTMIRSDST